MTKIKNHAVISNFDADIRKAERKKTFVSKWKYFCCHAGFTISFSLLYRKVRLH